MIVIEPRKAAVAKTITEGFGREGSAEAGYSANMSWPRTRHWPAAPPASHVQGKTAAAKLSGYHGRPSPPGPAVPPSDAVQHVDSSPRFEADAAAFRRSIEAQHIVGPTIGSARPSTASAARRRGRRRVDARWRERRSGAIREAPLTSRTVRRRTSARPRGRRS